MENGSGGFLSDLVFSGGSLGLYAGNQQFTVRGLTFTGQLTRAVEVFQGPVSTDHKLINLQDPLGLGLDLEKHYHL